jgi:arylformamidase
VIYFHAGYWQSRDKSQFRFLAPAFRCMGWHTALVNYPLCPEVRVAQIVDSASRALVHVHKQNAYMGHRGPIVLCGHSAGAHLAIELALRCATEPSPPAMAGVVAISGIYDLCPLIDTSLNERLQLDASTARACSPLGRVSAGASPALLVWGAAETQVFHEQSRTMAQRWQAQGNQAECLAVDAADHFSVLQHVVQPDSRVANALSRWAHR